MGLSPAPASVRSRLQVSPQPGRSEVQKRDTICRYTNTNVSIANATRSTFKSFPMWRSQNARTAKVCWSGSSPRLQSRSKAADGLRMVTATQNRRRLQARSLQAKTIHLVRVARPRNRPLPQAKTALPRLPPADPVPIPADPVRPPRPLPPRLLHPAQTISRPVAGGDFVITWRARQAPSCRCDRSSVCPASLPSSRARRLRQPQDCISGLIPFSQLSWLPW